MKRREGIRRSSRFLTDSLVAANKWWDEEAQIVALELFGVILVGVAGGLVSVVFFECLALLFAQSWDTIETAGEVGSLAGFAAGLVMGFRLRANICCDG